MINRIANDKFKSEKKNFENATVKNRRNARMQI
jgi:hypothetical protein